MPVHEGDRSILFALYNATDGPNWTNSANWLTDKPLNAWHGVETNSSGRVAELLLYSNRLRGEIPPELGGLSELVTLSFYQNELTGTIPPQLGDLSNLEDLDLRLQPAERGNSP